MQSPMLICIKSLSNGITFRDNFNNLSLKKGSGIKWTNPLADELHKPVQKNFPKDMCWYNMWMTFGVLIL